MKLLIDNLDGAGVRDYTAAVDAAHRPRIVRKLNLEWILECGLVADGASFVAPANGARIRLVKDNGQALFTGLLAGSPSLVYGGEGERGPLYRYSLTAVSDEAQLDRKRLLNRVAFVDRNAGDCLRQLTQDLLPGLFDISGVQDLDLLPSYVPDPQLKWSEHAAAIAVQARAAYRVLDGDCIFAPVGAVAHALNESDATFSPEALSLQSANGLLNDVTVIGEVEPQAYVKDYFVGDGLSLKFYLSQTPFTKASRTLFTEEYPGTALDATRWTAVDPSRAVSISGGKLQVAGGTGSDGETTVLFAEDIELGGALVLQHGDVLFSGASSGVLGGLYANTVSQAGCVAGFLVTPNGTESGIQALVSGAPTGPVVTTVAGHHYALTTRLYSLEIYRRQQIFHSTAHGPGSGRGGAELQADVRVVLELHEIDPGNPATLVAASTVLCDTVVASAPGFGWYALVNATNMQCAIAFTRMIQAADAEVRSAPPGAGYRTRLVGPLSDGAECNLASGSALDFFSQYVPGPNELIEVRYRGRGRAMARVTDPAGIAALARGPDDGVRAALRRVKAPAARTSADCENAALAMLDDGASAGVSGAYEAWSDFLPAGAEDVFPGDAMQMNVPSRGGAFSAIVREVDVAVQDLEGEHSRYKMAFADDAAASLAFEFEKSQVVGSLNVTALANAQVGAAYLPALSGAEITAVTSTTLSIDAGISPLAGGGVEVRWSDVGWGTANDRNLVGRFSVQNFVVPRLSRSQSCYLRQYDASVPPKYSRYSAALHVDYPL